MYSSSLELSPHPPVSHYLLNISHRWPIDIQSQLICGEDRDTFIETHLDDIPQPSVGEGWCTAEF